MRKLVVALSLLIGVEAAALACSCIAPGTPEQSRSLAREATRNAVAIVQVQALSEYRPGGPGELVRVHRTYVGKAPRTFRIERSDFASSASCDVLLTKGQRKVLILSRPEKPTRGTATYRIQSLCSDYLTEPMFLPITLQEARRARR